MLQFFRNNVRSIMIIVVVLFVISCFAGYGMYSGSGGGYESVEDRIVAKVNGRDIMLSRIELGVAEFLRAAGVSQPLSDDSMPAIRSLVLDQLAVESEIAREIDARGISVSTEELDASVREIENSFPTKEIFMQQLARSGLNERQFRASVEEQIKFSRLFEQVVAPASTDEAEKTAYYDTYKDFVYVRPEAIKANVAHFTSQAAAEKAKKELDAGKKWDDVLDAASADIFDATPYSETTTIPVESLRDQFAFIKDAPMDKPTKPIYISNDIVSEDYMIMLKREKQEAGVYDYNDVSADIQERIISQKQQTLHGQFVHELRARASVEILDKDLFAKNDPIAPEEADAASSAIEEIASDDAAESGDLTPASDDKSADKVE